MHDSIKHMLFVVAQSLSCVQRLLIWTQGQNAPWSQETVPFILGEISWYDLVTQIIKMLGKIAYEPTQFPRYNNMILLFTKAKMS